MRQHCCFKTIVKRLRRTRYSGYGSCREKSGEGETDWKCNGHVTHAKGSGATENGAEASTQGIQNGIEGDVVSKGENELGEVKTKVRIPPMEGVSRQNHEDLIRSTISNKLPALSTEHIEEVNFITRCIYESGEYCTYQSYYAVKCQILPPACELSSSGGFPTLAGGSETSIRALLADEVFVRVRLEDISKFMFNSSDVLVSPNLLLCLQAILFQNR